MIRHATILDGNEILTLVKELYPHTSYAKWAPFEDETVSNLINKITRTGIMLVAQNDDKLIGVIAVMGVPFLFNTNVIEAVEVVWWVLPEHQKAGIGWELLKRADSIRKLRGWKAFQMGRLEESSAALDKGFINLNFLPTEHCFTKVD